MITNKLNNNGIITIIFSGKNKNTTLSVVSFFSSIASLSLKMTFTAVGEYHFNNQ